MKTLSMILLMFSLSAYQCLPTIVEAPLSVQKEIITDYCDGWNDGYCEGWKDVKGKNAVCPVAPVCPVAEVGKSSYRDGYNRAFKAGRAAAKK